MRLQVHQGCAATHADTQREDHQGETGGTPEVVSGSAHGVSLPCWANRGSSTADKVPSSIAQ